MRAPLPLPTNAIALIKVYNVNMALKQRVLESIYHPSITPLLMIAAYASTMVGFFLAFIPDRISRSVLFENWKFGAPQAWGVGLLVSALLFVFGVYISNAKLKRLSAFFISLFWMFASIVYISALAGFQLLSFGVPNVLLWSYTYVCVQWAIEQEQERIRRQDTVQIISAKDE